MTMKRYLLCWGYNKIYELLKFEKAISEPSIKLKGISIDLALPYECYPFATAEDTLRELEKISAIEVPSLSPQDLTPEGITSQPNPQDKTSISCDKSYECGANQDRLSAFWLVSYPLVDFELLHVRVTGGDETFDYELTLDQVYENSDKNFHDHPTVCTEMIHYDHYFRFKRLRPRILHYHDGDYGDLWRLEIWWSDEPNVHYENFEPGFSIRGMDGHPLEFTPFFFEQQTLTESTANSDNAGSVLHKLTYSLEIHRPVPSFLLTVYDGARRLAPGYCSINERTLELARWNTWLYTRNVADDDEGYHQWFMKHRITAEELAKQATSCSNIAANRPLISIVMPCFTSSKDFLEEAIESVKAQSYPLWELIIVNSPSSSDLSQDPSVATSLKKGLSDANATLGKRVGTDKSFDSYEYVRQVVAADPDPRIHVRSLRNNYGIAGNTNIGISQARGKWVAFLDHDDLLEPNALFELSQTIAKHPEASLCYSDEDILKPDSTFAKPVFKTQLNLDLLYSHNCITHFMAVKKAMLDKIGPMDPTLSGAQDYDLALRVIGAGGQCIHIPHILYHWRLHESSTSGDNLKSKPYAQEAGRKALERHFADRGIAGKVSYTHEPFVYRMHYALPDPAPLISVLIPNKDHTEVLRPCVRSLLERSTYSNFEIIIIENNSQDPATFDYYSAIAAQDSRVSVITWTGSFNYSAIINAGAAVANGSYLLLLNNDTKLISPDGLQTMVGYFAREEVGVVGAKLYFRDHLVQHAGMLLGCHGAIAHVNQNFLKNRGGYRGLAVRPGNFSSVTGACQMVPKKIFDAVGGYEEALAIGFNDADFCLKVQEAGYRVVFSPYAEFYHYEFTSRDREAEDAEELQRWKEEINWMHQRWPKIFTEGDPYLNPNLDKNNFYYNLLRD